MVDRERVEDELRCGRPCTSKMEENLTEVRTLVKSDRRLTVRMICGELNLFHQTVHDILTEESGMQKICVQKWFQKTSPTNKRKNEETHAWAFMNSSKVTKFFFQTCHNR